MIPLLYKRKKTHEFSPYIVEITVREGAQQEELKALWDKLPGTYNMLTIQEKLTDDEQRTAMKILFNTLRELKGE